MSETTTEALEAIRGLVARLDHLKPNTDRIEMHPSLWRKLEAVGTPDRAVRFIGIDVRMNEELVDPPWYRIIRINGDDE